jgi:hypothetical protein
MTVPFRDEEAGALMRAEALEIENQELREEIERLRDRVGENRDAYVTNVERQLAEMKKENAHLRGERLETIRSLRSRGNQLSSEQQYVALGGVALVLLAAVVGLLRSLF